MIIFILELYQVYLCIFYAVVYFRICFLCKFFSDFHGFPSKSKTLTNSDEKLRIQTSIHETVILGKET